VLRAVLPPLIAAYAVFIAMVALSLRRPIARPHGHDDGSARVRLRRVLRTTVGGYVAFLVIVLILHGWPAEEPDAFASAVWGGAFLSGISLVIASGSSLLGRRSHRRW